MDVDDIDETLDDELEEEIDDTGLEEEPAVPPEPAEEEAVESIQDLVRQEAREAEPDVEETLLALVPDEEISDDTLAVKFEPPSEKEFTCAKCHLVKHRSQLKDKAKMLCRDCA